MILESGSIPSSHLKTSPVGCFTFILGSKDSLTKKIYLLYTIRQLLKAKK